MRSNGSLARKIKEAKVRRLSIIRVIKMLLLLAGLCAAIALIDLVSFWLITSPAE